MFLRRSLISLQKNIKFNFRKYSISQNINKQKSSNYFNRNKNLDFSSELKYARQIFPSLVNEVLDEQLIYHNNFPHLRNRYSRLMYYVCDLDDLYLPHVSLCMHAYKMFEKPGLLTEENIKKAAILGWLIRVNDSGMIVVDDIIDNSTFRYNRPTWHTLPENGIKAGICDSNFLFTSVFYLLQNHFSSHRSFSNILREYILDYATTLIDLQIDCQFMELDDFKNQQLTVKAYPLTIPYVTTAMYLANIDDQRLHFVAREFLKEIAIYLKYEDDVAGVFDDIEKECTDAAEGKSTWLAMQVMERGSELQKRTLKENYRKYDKQSLERVHKIYKEMGLNDLFEEYKINFYEVMFKKIQDLPVELPKQLFLDIMDFAMMGKLRA